MKSVPDLEKNVYRGKRIRNATWKKEHRKVRGKQNHFAYVMVYLHDSSREKAKFTVVSFESEWTKVTE